MANGGILELDPMPVSGTEAAAFAQTPQGIMLNQQLARQEMQGGGGPASQAAINPQIRQQGLLSANVSPGMPGAPQGFQGGDLASIYGLMAGFADDPTQVGQGYVQAQQQQQQLDRYNQPIEQYLRLYGNVNPYDFETDSLQKFHNNYVSTGQLDFNLLQRKNELTTTEQGFLNDAITNAQKAESSMAQMAGLASRFDERARAGDYTAGIGASFGDMLRNLTGNQDADQQLRTEFEQIRISEVVQNLPPGVASDKDVALVLAGWPPRNAGPAYIAGFLRGMQKLKAIEHAMATHGADFIARNRGQTGPGGTTQLSDWRDNAEWMAAESLRRFGGIYNPGDQYSPEQAAQMRYDQLYGSYGGGAVVDPGAAPQPGSSIVDTTPRREGESQRDYMLRRYGLN